MVTTDDNSGGAIPIKIDRDGLCCPIDGVLSLLLGYDVHHEQAKYSPRSHLYCQDLGWLMLLSPLVR